MGAKPSRNLQEIARLACGSHLKKVMQIAILFAVLFLVIGSSPLLAEGEPCWDNLDCGLRGYCWTEPGMCGTQGTCNSHPDCYPGTPVCGCDGHTYRSASCAGSAGVSVDFVGECELQVCSDNLDCDPGDYCWTEPGLCGSQGTCERRPGGCVDEWIPVCGCDGNTYVNEGCAARDGVSVAFEGECSELLEVDIDIKPGSYPNSANPSSKGVIPVAILTADDFDATSVDPLTVRFGPHGALETHGRGHLGDVDSDGDTDLILHFRTPQTGIACGDTSASLIGATFDYRPIEGTDTIRTVGCR